MADQAFDLDKYLAEKQSAAPTAAATPQPDQSFDLDKYLAEKSQPPSLLQRGFNGLLGADKAILGVAGQIGQKADSYLGAPVRSAIGAAQAGNDPWAAYKNQFGEDPSKAPTGTDIAAKAGVSTKPLGKFTLDNAMGLAGAFSPTIGAVRGLLPDDVKSKEFQPSAADIAGTGIDLAADPSNALLGAGEIKGAAKGVLGALPKGEQITEALSKAAQSAKSLAGSGAAKVGEALTGIPAEEIKTYANNSKDIKAMSKASDNSTAEAADTMRGEWQKDIQGTRKDLNDQISSVLKQSSARVDSAPILEALEKQKGKINAKLRPEEVSQIDDLKNKVMALAGEDGTMHISDAHDLKNYLMDVAKPAYNSTPIFPAGKNAQRAAQSGAGVARKAVNAAEPEIAAANNKLSQLHGVEDSMNKNMLIEGKPEASLLAAGSGGNPRNAKALEKLSGLTGADMSQDAKNLSAMRTFGSPAILPVDKTGKATTRIGLGTALGSGLGYLIGHAPGAAIGGALGGALTSPLALRTAIDSGLIGKEMIGKMAASPETAGLLRQALSIEAQPQGLLFANQKKGLLKDASSD